MAETLVNFRSNKGNKTILENIKYLENKITGIESSVVSEEKKQKQE
jgi:hypothetical protein